MFPGQIGVSSWEKAFYSSMESSTIAGAVCYRVLKAYAAFTRARHINNL